MPGYLKQRYREQPRRQVGAVFPHLAEVLRADTRMSWHSID
jgi:hypothetical protein